jgi:hypothetical protein
MSTVPVTALYGALIAIFYVLLSLNVSRIRGQSGSTAHENLPEPLRLANRAHGNAAEYIPLGVVLLLTLELSQGSWLWLHLLGGSLLVGRVLHAVGMIQKLGAAQVIGISLTWLTMLVEAIYLLVLRFR